MSEGSQDYLRKEPLSQEQKRDLETGQLLWQDEQTRIFYPENPLTPAQEGLHLRIESEGVSVHPKTREEWTGWLRHWAKAIGVGKVLSEGHDLPDMWQSFIGQSEFSPDDHLVTEIIGRNPRGAHWGRTAPFPQALYDHRDQKVSSESVAATGAVINRYFRRFWNKAIDSVELFSKDPIVYPPGSEQFEEQRRHNMSLEDPWKSDPMVKSDMFDIVTLMDPHVPSGIHLMLALADAPRRPWRDLAGALQGMAIAEQTAQLLEEHTFEGEPIAAWTSIRATGSWFGGFQKLKEEQAFVEGKVSPKVLKRHHRGAVSQIGEPDEWTMGLLGFHPHIYGAKNRDELIKLTERPKTEGGGDWKGIKQLPENERRAIRDMLNRELVPRMLPMVKGPIRPKAA